MRTWVWVKTWERENMGFVKTWERENMVFVKT